MQSSTPSVPWILVPFVRLLRWGREGLRAVTGHRPSGRDGSLDIGGAVLLLGAITVLAVVDAPLLLTVGGGIGMAILFVVARSWVVVRGGFPT